MPDLNNWQWYWILLLASFVLLIFSSLIVKSKFKKWTSVQNDLNLTGEQVARNILKRHGIFDVQVIQGKGMLSDFYNPKSKVINLSKSVFGQTSVSAAAVAAHEVGHAIQHNTNYKMIKVRNTILPSVSMVSNIGWAMFSFGFIFLIFSNQSSPFINVLLIGGVCAISAVLLFQLVTLPVEFNASKRAIKDLKGLSIISNRTEKGAKSVLRAAALTYVIAVIITIIELIRLLIIIKSRSN